MWVKEREKDHTTHTTVVCELIPPTQQKWQVQKQPQWYFFQSCTCYIKNLSLEAKSQQGLPQKTDTVLLVFKAKERCRTGHYTWALHCTLAKHMPLAERGAGKQAQHSTCWGLQTWCHFLHQKHVGFFTHSQTCSHCSSTTGSRSPEMNMDHCPVRNRPRLEGRKREQPSSRCLR